MNGKIIQVRADKSFDISIVNDDFVLDDGLETMVIISLFTDTREDLVENDPRGWWGSSVTNQDRQQAQFGSKLWLIHREKQVAETLVKMKEWCRVALQWMIDEGIVESIEVDAEYPKTGMIAVSITITRRFEKSVNFKFQALWEGQYGIQ